MSARQLARLGLSLLLLAALGAQQWAAQSHWHARASSAPGALQHPAGDSGERLPGHDCLWCQIASHAGTAPPPSIWSGHAADSAWTLVGIAPGTANEFPAPPAWAWQSRGPPAV